MNNINVRSLESRLINSSKQSIGNQNSNNNSKTFNSVLGNLINESEKEIKFSKHAMERMESRNIQLTDMDIKRLNSAFDKAEIKGVKDALILMDNQAFIASIKNKTVITAVEKETMEENIFTNIDGAVII